jgi:ArsR family transcriptional regulator, arsenate/arsenite/antimonite-responsive transcriptional repressor
VKTPTLIDRPDVCCAPVAGPDLTSGQAGALASVFKALADPHRVRIVSILANAEEPVCVCDLVPRLGLSQGTVSFHLKKLVDVGLLRREPRGTWSYYSVNRERLEGLAAVFEDKEVAR